MHKFLTYGHFILYQPTINTNSQAAKLCQVNKKAKIKVFSKKSVDKEIFVVYNK